MALIKSQLVLTDGMTGPLKRGELERARAWGERLARAGSA